MTKLRINQKATLPLAAPSYAQFQFQFLVAYVRLIFPLGHSIKQVVGILQGLASTNTQKGWISTPNAEAF